MNTDEKPEAEISVAGDPEHEKKAGNLQAAPEKPVQVPPATLRNVYGGNGQSRAQANCGCMGIGF